MATYNGTTLNDTVFGSGLSDLLFGLAGNDFLGGQSGHDTLDGGTGSDTLQGDLGSDTYVVDSAKDVVIETGGDTDDRILASVAIDLNSAAYDGIEHVTLTGKSGLSATGDEAGNRLIGNDGANKLDGKGGDDTLAGGVGNDTYEVDDPDDTVIEFAGGGTDQVNSGSDFILSAHVENLTLTGTDGNNGVGNALANKITGNAGANNLFGDSGNDTLTGNDGDDVVNGGAGGDSLSGGKGDDTYVVDDAGDKVSESGPATDTDLLLAEISYVLGANIEELALGDDDINGTGNTLTNTLTGGDGVNVLSGLAGDDTMMGLGGKDLLMGGDGADEIEGFRDGDTLVGGAGSDLFTFTGSGSGKDFVADFSGLPGGDLIDVGQLLSGVTAATADQFLETVTANGSTTLRIDTNGGANSFVNLAVLAGVSTDLDGLLANGALAGIGALTPTTIAGTSGGDTLATGATSQLVQGLAGNDSLTGGAGSDTLDGGTGTDTLAGGGGNDSYIVDSAKDAIIESGGADDRVLASIAIDLGSVVYDGIEHVTLTGTAGIGATGDELANLLIGNSGANKLDGKAGDDTMAGGAGSDTYEVDTEDDVIVEFASEGTDQVNVSGDFSYTLGAFAENLTVVAGEGGGGGNALANKMTGNAGRNSFFGEAGNDTLTGNDGGDLLDGGAGADSMNGGAGDDTYLVDNVGDKVVETGKADVVDLVSSTISYTLGSNIEILQLQGADAISGTGNTLKNSISGNEADNVLSGLAGDDGLGGGLGQDLLLGGDGNDFLNAQEGEDTLVGGAGNDLFSFAIESLDGLDVIVDFNGLPGFDVLAVETLLNGVTAANAGDFLRTETSGGETTIQVDLDGGADNFVDLVVLAGVSTDLDGLIANASFRGLGGLSATPVTGTSGGDTLAAATTSTLVQGLGGNDSLTGGAGFDTLDGGTGTDTLFGGAGSDTYVVDSTKDAVAEASGDDDRVLASVSIDLQSATYDGIEHVTLTGTAGLSVTGDEGENAIFGNAGANKLDGKGGVDLLAGGAGSDTYEVDHELDFVFENPDEGTDQVNSSISHNLRDNVENLTLTGTAVTGSGNDSANKITGNAQANFLNGGGGSDTLTGNDGADNINGGAGADSMSGGVDDDFYVVDDAGDKIAESSAGGKDTVASTITYVLGANLENLLLANTTAIDGTGNTLANAITGSDGDNVLSGLAGNDTLEGSDGNDLLLGGDGNDELFIDAGDDTLVGGSDVDTFVFGPVLSGVDVIADFNGGPGGDLIDLTNLLNGFDPESSNVHDYLQTVVDDGSTVLRIDANGTGTNFVDAAVLQGVNTDVMALVSNGSIEFTS